MSFWRQKVVQPVLDQDVEVLIAEQRAVLQRDPRNSRAHFVLGTLLHYRGERQAALECFRQAIKNDPSYAAPHVSAGRLLAVDGNLEGALKHARAAERLGDRSLVELLERYSDEVQASAKAPGEPADG